MCLLLTVRVQAGIHEKSKVDGQNTAMSSVSFADSMVHKKLPTTIPYWNAIAHVKKQDTGLNPMLVVIQKVLWYLKIFPYWMEQRFNANHTKDAEWHVGRTGLLSWTCVAFVKMLTLLNKSTVFIGYMCQILSNIRTKKASHMIYTVDICKIICKQMSVTVNQSSSQCQNRHTYNNSSLHIWTQGSSSQGIRPYCKYCALRKTDHRRRKKDHASVQAQKW